MKFRKLQKDLVLKNGIIIDPHNRKTFYGDVWLKNGKIAAILIKGEEVTIKKVKSEGNLIKLIPANSEYKEQTYSSSDIEIQGELKGLIRKYN